jgi:putative DNA primase/helicase
MADNVFTLEAWKGKLQTSRNGVRKNISNLVVYVEHLKELGAALRWNELSERVEWNGRELADTDLVEIRMLLEASGFEAKAEDLLLAVKRQALRAPFHPVCDYLAGLEWDYTPRLDYWMRECLGSPGTRYVATVGRKMLIAAVARAFKPGCKVDTMLVLEGEQGILKSTAIGVLFGEQWTAESTSLFDQHNKMVMGMMGQWCIELSEFIAVSRRDLNTVKGLLSIRSDRVVLPYAKLASDHPRRCVFFGTINPGESGYLTDGTGNRRYWPVPVARADLACLRANRDQLWAEAVFAFEAGEPWWLDAEEERLAAGEVDDRELSDVWVEILLGKLRGEAWPAVTCSEALWKLGVANERMGKREADRVAACLRQLGYVGKKGKKRDEDGERRSVVIFTRA